MAVRNFWVEGIIDGRATELCGGPASKTGGMRLNIYQRNEGSIETALKIDCYESDGILTTRVLDENGDVIFEHETER